MSTTSPRTPTETNLFAIAVSNQFGKVLSVRSGVEVTRYT